jgi:hypothetical protein
MVASAVVWQLNPMSDGLLLAGKAVVPVPMQSNVPAALFKYNLARGKYVPVAPTFDIHNPKLIVEPEGTVPVAFGTPVLVKKFVMKYSPTGSPVRSPVLFDSGPKGLLEYAESISQVAPVVSGDCS